MGGTRGWRAGACRPICALPLDLCATGAIESLVLVPRRLEDEVTDWEARANREAAQIIAEVGTTRENATADDYVRVQHLLALSWLKGFRAGTVETLDEATAAIDRLVQS